MSPIGTASCPGGPPLYCHLATRQGFTAKRCATCPLKPRRTTAKGDRAGRQTPRHHDPQQAVRRQAASDPHPMRQVGYRRWRPAVERVITLR